MIGAIVDRPDRGRFQDFGGVLRPNAEGRLMLPDLHAANGGDQRGGRGSADAGMRTNLERMRDQTRGLQAMMHDRRNSWPGKRRIGRARRQET